MIIVNYLERHIFYLIVVLELALNIICECELW